MTIALDVAIPGYCRPTSLPALTCEPETRAGNSLSKSRNRPACIGFTERTRIYTVDTGMCAMVDVDTILIQEGHQDMRSAVKKWGNSASVRIPAAVMQAAHLDLDEPVDVREESGRIVIEPIRRKEYDLAELVNGITSRNLHDEIAFSGPVGKEIW